MEWDPESPSFGHGWIRWFAKGSLTMLKSEKNFTKEVHFDTWPPKCLVEFACKQLYPKKPMGGHQWLNSSTTSSIVKVKCAACMFRGWGFADSLRYFFFSMSFPSFQTPVAVDVLLPLPCVWRSMYIMSDLKIDQCPVKDSIRIQYPFCSIQSLAAEKWIFFIQVRS